MPRKSSKETTIYTVVQPDICIVCDPSKIDEKGCIGAPDIVIEILSPGNNKKEVQNKFEAYEEALIKEYWIIHPNEHTFLKDVFNEENKYYAERLLTVGNEVTTPILPGLVLSLEEVFANPIE